MIVRRTKQGYEQLLRDQFTLLTDAVAAFYGGNYAKAIDIAVRIRTLVHQSDSSRALLFLIEPDYFQLPIFHKIPMAEAVLSVNQGVQVGSGKPKFVPPNFSSPSYSFVSLQRWWNEPYLFLGPNRTSKKQVVLDLANKDGGAHVDPEVPVRYAAASEPPVVFGSGDGDFVRLNLARGTVAQAGSELLAYLECHFREIFAPVLPPPTLESVKTAAAAGFQPLPRPDSIRVPFVRASNFSCSH